MQNYPCAYGTLYSATRAFHTYAAPWRYVTVQRRLAEKTGNIGKYFGTYR